MIKEIAELCFGETCLERTEVEIVPRYRRASRIMKLEFDVDDNLANRDLLLDKSSKYINVILKAMILQNITQVYTCKTFQHPNTKYIHIPMMKQKTEDTLK